MPFLLLLAASLAAASLTPWEAPVCQSKPALQIVAGSVVSSQFDCSADQNLRCEAVLQFRDKSFLPYVVDFAGDKQCSSDHVCLAEFIIPLGSPNGPATLFWLCAGQTASVCVEAEIKGGRSDAGSLRLGSSGTLLCTPKSPSESSAGASTTASASRTASSGTSLPTPTKLEVIPIDRVRRHLSTAPQ